MLRGFYSSLISQYHNGTSDRILNPSGVLTELNKELIAQKLGKHLVIFYGLIDMQENSLFYCNGGQFPMPILSSAGEQMFIPGKGMLVGLFPQAEYKCSGLPLPDEFSIYLFSDGVLELSETDNIEVQQEKLLKIASVPHRSISELEKMAGLKPEQELPDDVSILHIERRNA